MVDVRDSGPCDIIRYVISAILLSFSLVVTVYAIIFQNTMFWDIVPGWLALILFVVDLFILGVVEGLQIALVELKRQHPNSYKKSHPIAYKIGQIASAGDNIERFLMGRQVFVVVLVFFCAKLTTIHLEKGEDFLFPIPHWFQVVFLESGILSCLVVVIIAQLMPQIVAAKYPVHFLQIFVMRPAYYMCIFVETTGITHICWILSHLLSLAAGMKEDEEEFDKMKGYYDKESSSGTSTSDDSEDRCYNTFSPEVMGLMCKTENAFTNIEDRIEEQQFSRFTDMVRKTNALVTPDIMVAMRNYLDQHPEKFSQFPVVIGSKMYPAPQSLAARLTADGQAVPKFLSDISDPDHIPPHIVAYELLAENRALRQELNFLQAKLNSATQTQDMQV